MRDRKAIQGELNKQLAICPHCGGGAAVRRNYIMDTGNTVVWCTNCYCMTAPYPTPSDAYDAWNTRTPDPLLTEALDVLQDFVDKVESGRARSKDTYAKCKAILTKAKEQG